MFWESAMQVKSRPLREREVIIYGQVFWEREDRKGGGKITEQAKQVPQSQYASSSSIH
jgi:hypothetical protein